MDLWDYRYISLVLIIKVFNLMCNRQSVFMLKLIYRISSEHE